ncbi:MAG: phage integrase N-terminal domain-containing protein [Mariprofundaceae bacterium]|nr:phage integrase N-terminal domain-containing protein [Mariprofundaceae bacterium]
MKGKGSFSTSVKNLILVKNQGSYATRSAQIKTMQQAAKILSANGLKVLSAQSLKPKHVSAIIDSWKKSKNSERTIANKVSHLRQFTKMIGKPNIISPTNAELGLKVGLQRHSETSKASDGKNIGSVGGKSANAPYYQASLGLAREFGLRREEAMKIVPTIADKGDHIALRGSWCKGGRPRTVEVRTENQRSALNAAKAVSRGRSLISPQKSYKSHSAAFGSACKRAGIKAHALRHHYAQSRYFEITGKKPPALGGKSKAQMTKDERFEDSQARIEISNELGHGREDVTNAYLGN